jgi:hypothetical protein
MSGNGVRKTPSEFWLRGQKNAKMAKDAKHAKVRKSFFIFQIVNTII